MFQKIIRGCVKLVQRFLPEPFIFAVILTVVAFLIAMPVCRQTPLEVVEHWGNGVWSLLAFAMQMALVLVCGSTLAAAPAIKKGISALASLPKTPAGAIAIVTGVSAVACWLNWGFGLIVGVIFAKEIARKLRGVDYRLLIASAYSGFVVWHAGISGSIPLTMATPGNGLKEITRGALVNPVPISQTVLDPHNLIMVALVIAALVLVNSLMHPKGNQVITVDPALLVEEEPNDTFIRDDNNLIYNLLLDFPTAALGGDVEIPTIEGTRLKVKMEPGTQPGKTLRLRGKGLPAVQGYGRGNGDLVVNVSVYVPKTLTSDEKRAIEQFRQSDNFKGDAATKRSIFQKFRNYFS